MTDLQQNIQTVLEQSDCLYTETEIQQAVVRIAAQITEDLQAKNPVVISVLNGGLLMTAELLTKLGFPLELNYLHATRYGDKTEGGQLKWHARPTCSLQGRVVLLVDDILDEGVTLENIVAYCNEVGAAEVYTVVMVDKYEKRPQRRFKQADYTALEVVDRYVFGYGMDYQHYLRNAPGIYALKDG